MRAFTAYSSRILAGILLFAHFPVFSAQILGILPTPAARLPQHNVEQHGIGFDKWADIQTRMSTCGFLDGDPNQGRIAPPGFECLVNTMDGLWGFCTDTIIIASECEMAGSCFDQGPCSSGCGQTTMRQLTTITCDGLHKFCSTAYLELVDQRYTYIACGDGPKTDYYLPSPTAQPSSATTTSSEQTSTAPVSSSATASPGSASGPSRPSTTGALAKETNGSSGSDGGGGSHKNNTGAIIGGVIGGIALLCLSGIAAVLLLQRTRSRPHQTPMNGAQREPHQAWYDLGSRTKSNHRFTGGWGPRELPTPNSARVEYM
ncbi:hypothetical protein HDV64DRAFT_290632 [Trichoderma sp. TUCIM 5745]